MKVLCYSKKAYDLALKLEESLPISIYSKYKEAFKTQEVVQAAFKENEDLIFISATGIAVRFIAPFLNNKEQDPAVLVIDDQGRFVISLCSGHLGGANDLARSIAEKIGAVPVITTATDGRGYEGLDLYAKKMHFNYQSIHDLTPLTGAMVDDKKIFLYNPYNFQEPKYPNFTQDMDSEIGYSLAITDEESLDLPGYTVYLRPQILHLGLGCKKGANYEELKLLLKSILKKLNLSLASIKDMASIDIKKDEVAFNQLSKDLGIDFFCFKAEELSPFEDKVQGSDFVKKTVGVSSVSATSALKLGGELILEKEAYKGFTVSISREV